MTTPTRPREARDASSEHEPVSLPGLEEFTDADDTQAELPVPAALTFEQPLPADRFFKQGLGNNNTMIFKKKEFLDRALVRKALLSGQSDLKLSRVVDLYHHVSTKDGKRRKIRPSLAQAWGAS